MCFASPVPSLSSPPFPSGLPPSLALSSHSHFSHPSAPLPFIFPASYIATFAYPTLPLSSLPLSLSLPHSLTHSSSPLSPHVALNSLFYLYSLSLSPSPSFLPSSFALHYSSPSSYTARCAVFVYGVLPYSNCLQSLYSFSLSLILCFLLSMPGFISSFICSLF